jgi:hypothetical protein
MNLFRFGQTGSGGAAVLAEGKIPARAPCGFPHENKAKST